MLETIMNDANKWLKKYRLRLIRITEADDTFDPETGEGATTDPAPMAQNESPFRKKLRRNLAAKMKGNA